MQQHGARPTWLGYIGVEDTDAAVASIEQAGGKALMPAFDLPNVGRIAMVSDPQGAPFYVMKPIPPEGRRPNGQSDVFSVDQPQRVRWNELSTSRPRAARSTSTATSSAGTRKATWTWAKWANTASSTARHDHRRGHAKPPQLPVTQWTYYIGVDESTARRSGEVGRRAIVNGPMEIPGGEFAARNRPAGRRSASSARQVGAMKTAAILVARLIFAFVFGMAAAFKFA